MGSHYIPVGKLKIDKYILDIACPAAGYDTTPPDPAIYCPANGYTVNDAWIPPVIFPNPDGSGGDQILLLCDDKGASGISVTYTVNTGNRKWEILSTDMTVLQTGEVSGTGGILIPFPTSGTGTYYIVRLSAAAAGAQLRTYTTGTPSGYSASDVRIIQAKFYTPNLTTLASAFLGIVHLKECIFLTNMNALTSMSGTFSSSGVMQITWPTELNACTTMANVCLSTKSLQVFDISGVSLNNLQSLVSAAKFSGCKEIKLPASLPACTTMQDFARECPSLKKITWPTSLPLVTTINYACYNSSLLEGEQLLPPLPSLLNSGGVFYGCTSITKVIYQGPSDLCTDFGSVVRNDTLLEELVMPTSLNALTNTYSYFAYGTSLKKLTLPNSMSALTDSASYAFTGLGNIVEEISTCNNWGSNSLSMVIGSHKLKAFHQPSLRVKRLTIGFSATQRAPLTALEVDWANSTFDTTGTVILIYAELPTAEINRIYTALPTLTGKTIDVRNNPGFSTANHAIAQAKGWTVSGA